jgi:selenocysteine lyase/cysteine desulfurase
VAEIKSQFAKLINCPEPDRVALAPAASYGIATVAKNLPLERQQNIIVVEGQFPSNYYSWEVLCRERGAELRTVKRPVAGAAGSWSDRVLETIDKHTAAVAIAQLHWVDGTLFDLGAIRKRTDEVGAWLVIDGTQSLGAYPMDVQQLKPDALICGGYKWLMGPYGCGYAYYGPRMDDGSPLEENWINRAGSEDFRNLTNYRSDYRPLAGRYSTGQHSNFFMAPMQVAALRQVNAWTPEVVQEHCAGLWSQTEAMFNEAGVELPVERAHHLVGLRLPAHIDGDKLSGEIERRGLSVSYRGDAVRVSPNVYSTKDEMSALAEAFVASARGNDG